MTPSERKRFNSHLAAYTQRIEITPGVRSLIYSLACIEIEEEILQKFVSKEGTTYTTPSGIVKQRPEWQQLRDDRQRKTAIVGRLENLVSHEPVEADPLAELHAHLD